MSGALVRATPETAWDIPAPPPKRIPADANPTFEVATIKVMVQTLLADRLQLTFHREKIELPVYGLHLLQDVHLYIYANPNRNAIRRI
jgi:uncharacterized protein (TIGR03435 family)